MFVLMGANGNITSKAARRLLARHAPVRVIGRDLERLKELQEAGAECLAHPKIDSTEFLTRAFEGATAVYTMIPPGVSAPEHRRFQNSVGEAIAQAIVRSGVKRVVNLSSAGASLSEGTGAITGLHDQEKRLNSLEGVEVLHLRPGSFMENLLHAIPLIRTMGRYPGFYAPDAPIAMVATQDISDALADELASPGANRRGVRQLLGPRSVTMTEAAAVLGAAIGKPDLSYVQGDPEKIKAGMVRNGFSQDVANRFEEMARAHSDGRISATYIRDAANSTPTTLEHFAQQVFAPAYSSGGGH